jgi:hypothetical protein
MNYEESLLVVDEIYQRLCRAALNSEYYQARLSNARYINVRMDGMIAFGITGSALSAFTIWEAKYGGIVWGVFTCMAGLCAILKSIFGMNQQLERLSKLSSGHADNYSTLQELVAMIKLDGKITPGAIALLKNLPMKMTRDCDYHS